MNININPKIFTANGEELTSYALFHDMVKIMKASDGAEPAGACCGRNTKQIVNSFLNNKQKYVDFMENINKRLIKPLRKGVVYISPMKKMLNYEFMTDAEILICVKKGYLSEKIFDWTEYNLTQKPVEEPIVEETPEKTPAEEEPIAEEPIAEEPVTEEPVTEETPIAEPIAEETPVVKPKRNSKKGSK